MLTVTHFYQIFTFETLIFKQGPVEGTRSIFYHLGFKKVPCFLGCSLVISFQEIVQVKRKLISS